MPLNPCICELRRKHIRNIPKSPNLPCSKPCIYKLKLIRSDYLATDGEHSTMAITTKIIPEIKYTREHPWATVAAAGGEKKVSVCLTGLLYDEEGGIYLLVHEHPFQERRLYIS